MDDVGLRVPEGVSVVIPPTVPLLCHAGLRPVDLLPLALILKENGFCILLLLNSSLVLTQV